MLPTLRYDSVSDGKQYISTSFKGLNYTLTPDAGELYDMKNLSSENSPVISVRKNRTEYNTVSSFHGICTNEKIAYVDGTVFYYDGVNRGTLTDTDKTFGIIGQYICIWPDKKAFNVSSLLWENMEYSYTSTAGAITFSDGTYNEVFAEANTITTSGAAFTGFSVGDAVRISGCTAMPYNNRTPVIREISDDKRTLRFYEHTFRLPDEATTVDISVGGETKHAKTATEPGAITIAREVPDLEYVTENENRLWGCISGTDKGDVIMSCSLGKPFVWYDYSGLGDSSYTASVGSDGSFTGACTYLGYAIFFKESAIHKIYGSKPSNYQIMSSADMGVKTGCAKSLAIANETLFYVSPKGVACYQGGEPILISGRLGNYGLENAVAGSDMKRYWLSARDGEVWNLFVYDPARGMWMKEDNTRAAGFTRGNDSHLYCADISAAAKHIVGFYGANADGVPWFAEWGDFMEKTANKKVLRGFQLEIAMDYATEADVYISYDNGDFVPVRHLSGGERKGVYSIPLVPRRCTHYKLRIEGTGGCDLYSVTRYFVHGSDGRRK